VPIDTIREAADWLNENHTLGTGTEVVLDTASLALQPRNKIFDQWMQNIQSDDAPEGMDIVPMPEEQGINIYCSRVNEGPDTLMRQNLEPLPPETDSFSFTDPIISGGVPQRQNEFTTDIPSTRPDSPIVNVVEATTAGFPAGDYYVAFSAVTPRWQHTLLTEPVQTETPLSAGQLLEVTLPRELPRGTTMIGIWVSEPDGDITTLRLQETIRFTGKLVHALKGPWRAGIWPPGYNQTALSAPRRPKWGARDGDWWKEGKSWRDLSAFKYTIMLRYVNARGTSPTSAASGTVNIKNTNRRTHLAVRPYKPDPDATGYLCYVKLDWGSGAAWYQLARPRLRDPYEPFNPRQKVPIWGIAVADLNRKKWPRWVPDRIDYVLVHMKDRPKVQGQVFGDQGSSENGTGIATPEYEAVAPRGIGASRPGAGSYYLSFTRVIDNRETPMAPPVRVTIDSTDVMEMTFPDRVNRLRNALFSERVANGDPAGWWIARTSPSTVTPTAPGYIEGRTNGTIASGTFYPEITSAKMRVRPDRIETWRGVLEVSQWTAGTVKANIVFYDTANVQMAAGTEITLASLASAGRKEWTVKIGPASLGGIEPPAGADQMLLDINTSGSRNMTWRVSSLAVHPFDGAPRKFDTWSPGQRLPARATLDPSIPWPSGSMARVGTPPPTPALAAVVSGEEEVQSDLIESMNFDSGALNAGWSISRSPVNVDTEAAVSTSAALEGTHGFRVRDDSESSKVNAHIWKTHGNRGNLGNNYCVRFVLRLTRNPTAYGQYEDVFWTYSDSDAEAGIFIGYWNDVYIWRTNSAGSYSQRWIGDYPNGTILDIEQCLWNGGSSTNASVEWYVGVNGGPRNWAQGYYSQDLRDWWNLGCVIGSDTGTKYATSNHTFDYDSVIVTKNGWFGPPYVPPTPDPPPGDPLPEPDRPRKAGTILHSASGAVDHTITTGNRSTASGKTRVAVGAALPAANRTLLEVKNSAGTTVLADAILQTNGAVVVRSGTTTRQVGTVLANQTFDIEIVVVNAGTTGGLVSGYFNLSTASRKLYSLFSGRDFSTAQAQRVQVYAAAEYTLSAVEITERGTTEYRELDPYGNTINQAYHFYSPDQPLDGDEGVIISEGFVTPELLHTFAVQVAHDSVDLEKGAHLPLFAELLNDSGDIIDVGSVYGVDGILLTASDWTDRALTFTPPEGYYRFRVRHRGMLSGSLRWQEPLLAEGNLNTPALRDAERVRQREVMSTASVILEGRIPEGRENEFGEQWVQLSAGFDTPEGDPYTLSVDIGTNLITAPGNRYRDGGQVRVRETSGTGSLPAPLAIDTTYFVRDHDGTNFRLAATSGGAAIDLTSAGTGTLEIYGWTSVDATYRSGESLPLGGSPVSDPDLVTPHVRYAEINVTLRGDGDISPEIDAGGLALFYVCRPPMLCTADRKPLIGGCVVTKLTRPYQLPEFSTEDVLGRARGIPVTEDIGRIRPYGLEFRHPDGWREFVETQMDGNWTIEAPAQNSIILVKQYEVAELPEREIELMEEVTGYQADYANVGRAEVLDEDVLIPVEG
jgi:hypothetical protein